MTTPGTRPGRDRPPEDPGQLAGQARAAAAQAAVMLDAAPPGPGYPEVARAMAAACDSLGESLRVLAGPARLAGPADAASALRAAARICAAALPDLTAAAARPGSPEGGPGADPSGLLAAGAARAARDASARLASALAAGAGGTGPGALAGDIAATLAFLGTAAENAAFGSADPAPAASLHASSFLITTASGAAADASAMLPGGCSPVPRPAGPASLTPPSGQEVAAHVRRQEAVALYRGGRPPRDGRDTAWHAQMARADLAGEWRAAREDHLAGRGPAAGHEACPAGGCFLSGDPPGRRGEAQAARWLADNARAGHLAGEHQLDCVPAGTCPWDSIVLPRPERAARALERIAAARTGGPQTGGHARRPADGPRPASPARQGTRR